MGDAFDLSIPPGAKLWAVAADARIPELYKPLNSQFVIDVTEEITALRGSLTLLRQSAVDSAEYARQAWIRAERAEAELAEMRRPDAEADNG